MSNDPPDGPIEVADEGGRRTVVDVVDEGRPSALDISRDGQMSGALDAARDRRRSWIVLTIVLAVTGVVYFPLFGQSFLQYDDDLYITANAIVRRGLSLDGIRYAFTTTDLGNWHPLNWLSHMLDVQIFGLRAGAMKGVNLALHLLNSALLFLVFRRMTGALWRSAFISAVFALHPLHVASVAWIAERKDVLSTTFGLLTLWFWTVHVQARAGASSSMRSPSQTSAPSPSSASGETITSVGTRGQTLTSPRARALALVFFALGLLTKPMLVTLPIVLLLLDIWPFRRREPVRPMWVEKAPFFAMALGAGIAALAAQSSAGALQTIPFSVRLGNAITSLGQYLLATAWPAGLAFFYPHPRSIDLPALLASSAWIVVLTILCWRWRRSAGWLFTGWLWFLIMLVPVLGLIQIGGQARADRYMYLPMVGLTIVLAWGAHALVTRAPQARIVCLLLAGLIVVACAWRTRTEVAYWKDDITLATRATQVTEDNHVAHSLLGVAWAARGDLDRALEHHAEAARILPDRPAFQTNLGKALLLKGQIQEAVPYFERAVQLDPTPSNQVDLAGAELSRGNRDRAYQMYRAVLEKSPDLPEARFGLATVLTLTGKLEEAVREYERTLELAPTYVDAHVNFGLTLTHLGRFDEAITQFEAALALAPENARAQTGVETARRQKAARAGAGS